MKDLNFNYIVSGVVFGYLMFMITKQLPISIILGVALAFGGNTACIFKRSKDNDGELLTDEEEKQVWEEFQGKVEEDEF